MRLAPLRTLAPGFLAQTLGSALPYLVLFGAIACSDSIPTAPTRRIAPVSVPAAGRMSSPGPIAGPRIGNGPIAGAMSIHWPGSEKSGAMGAAASAAGAPIAAGRLLWQKPSTENHSIWMLDPTSWTATFVEMPEVIP